MTPVRLEPAAPRSRVKHPTTEPLRSLYIFLNVSQHTSIWFLSHMRKCLRLICVHADVSVLVLANIETSRMRAGKALVISCEYAQTRRLLVIAAISTEISCAGSSMSLVYSQTCMASILPTTFKNELRHENFKNVVCATSKASDQPAHTRSLIRVFASRLNIDRTSNWSFQA